MCNTGDAEQYPGLDVITYLLSRDFFNIRNYEEQFSYLNEHGQMSPKVTNDNHFCLTAHYFTIQFKEALQK